MIFPGEPIQAQKPGENTMSHHLLDIAATPGIHAIQAAMERNRLWRNSTGHLASNRFTHREATFIARHDSFCIAFMPFMSETG